VNNQWRGYPDAVLWEVPWDRPSIIGAILALQCSFEHCTFFRSVTLGDQKRYRQLETRLISFKPENKSVLALFGREEFYSKLMATIKNTPSKVFPFSSREDLR
jgi:hypothetical protein